MVRASASKLVDLWFNLVESYHKTLKMVFTASLLGGRHLGEVVKNKPVSALVSLGKALHGTPRLYVEDRWSRHHENGNSQASSDDPSKV